MPGLILTVFWIAGTVVSIRRGWREELLGIVVLTLLAGLPGLWLVKGGLASTRTHPLIMALRYDPKQIASVGIEWRGGGNHYTGRVVVQLHGYRPFRLLAPKGREEELANWLRGLTAP